MGSNGETPHRAAVDDFVEFNIDTNPRKLPKLRSLNPLRMRVIESDIYEKDPTDDCTPDQNDVM